MNGFLLENLYFRWGCPRWFWALVFLIVLFYFFVIDVIAQKVFP